MHSDFLNLNGQNVWARRIVDGPGYTKIASATRFCRYVRGTGLARRSVMTLQAASVLRWVFRRGDKSLTCLVQRSGAESSYDICVVPHWDLTSAVVEEADTPIRAFCRHAEIALALRAAGWSVVERSRCNTTAAAL